jgi:hypothetical protein
LRLFYYFPAEYSSSAKYNTAANKTQLKILCHFDPRMITGKTNAALTMNKGIRFGGGVETNPIAIKTAMLTTSSTRQREFCLNCVIAKP